MMIEFLTGYTGALEVNGIMYNSLDAVVQALNGFSGELTLKLNIGAAKQSPAPQVEAPKQETKAPQVTEDKIYKIQVRQYMTKPASPQFEFHTKWNNDIPMPMRPMVGKILKQTPGMYKMELWGEITQEVTSHCMKCGKALNNPVSKFFGIGPECGGHNYINPFNSEEELKQAVEQMKKQLRNIKWTGWVIKSAIEEMEVIEQ